MQLLQESEIAEVAGGVAPAVIIVGSALVVGFAVGVYIGYQDAKKEAASKD